MGEGDWWGRKLGQMYLNNNKKEKKRNMKVKTLVIYYDLNSFLKGPIFQ